MSLQLTPITLKQAKEFVGNEHRHHAPPVGHKFSIGASVDGRLCGVVVVGRPVSRMTDAKGTVAEVTRLCTDGTKNACSFLYSAAARAAKAMGYLQIQTYILETESGHSVQASGWRLDGYTSGGQWQHTKGKPRRTDQPTCPKARWVKDL